MLEDTKSRIRGYLVRRLFRDPSRAKSTIVVAALLVEVFGAALVYSAILLK